MQVAMWELREFPVPIKWLSDLWFPLRFHTINSREDFFTHAVIDIGQHTRNCLLKQMMLVSFFCQTSNRFICRLVRNDPWKIIKIDIEPAGRDFASFIFMLQWDILLLVNNAAFDILPYLFTSRKWIKSSTVTVFTLRTRIAQLLQLFWGTSLKNTHTHTNKVGSGLEKPKWY